MQVVSALSTIAQKTGSNPGTTDWKMCIICEKEVPNGRLRCSGSTSTAQMLEGVMALLSRYYWVYACSIWLIWCKDQDYVWSAVLKLFVCHPNSWIISRLCYQQ